MFGRSKARRRFARLEAEQIIVHLIDGSSIEGAVACVFEDDTLALARARYLLPAGESPRFAGTVEVPAEMILYWQRLPTPKAPSAHELPARREPVVVAEEALD